jgi:hypothetical protein
MAIGITLYGDDNQMTRSGDVDDIYRGFLTYFERLNHLYRDKTIYGTTRAKARSRTRKEGRG